MFRLTLRGAPLYNITLVVTVVQLVERQIVILVVAGSSPVGHPILKLIKSLPRGRLFFFSTEIT